ncbi:HNH endonuclease [Microvirga sesbaniae]|uniref:HNH endonuclease n=1 Tax=Microvirga sesbaniae TaxID=681392 RepID=UPI0021C8645C|nr:HNH endonuclease [Microvirga sp. HBU67692]
MLPVEWVEAEQIIPAGDLTKQGTTSAVPVRIDDGEAESLLRRLTLTRGLADKGDGLTDITEDELEHMISADIQIDHTEREAVIKARRGQGVYRMNLEMIEKRCRVTGVSDPRLLRANHIKPWRACKTNEERLDGYNGLLLTPNVDHLFDQGYITFDDDGGMRVSSLIQQKQLRKLGLVRELINRPRPFRPEQIRYLEYHREYIFKG